MKKIAVTGANGFVGKHLVRELVANGYAVLAIGGNDLPTDESLENVSIIAADLSNPEEVATIDLSDVHAIIHLAGLAAVGPSFDDPMHYLSTNAGLEVNLFQRAIQQAVTPRFIIVSSGALYDPTSGLPVTEAANVLPNSPYAVSKIAQEQFGQYYGSRGFEVIVARPFNHIGPGQNLGFLVPDLASQVVAAEKTGTHEVLVGNLDAKRDYTDVRDIARAYRLLVEKGKPGQTYNICSGSSLSGHEILEQVIEASGTKPTIVPDPGRLRPSDTPYIYGSHDKLTNDTGWQPEIKLEQTIRDVITDWGQRN